MFQIISSQCCQGGEIPPVSIGPSSSTSSGMARTTQEERPNVGIPQPACSIMQPKFMLLRVEDQRTPICNPVIFHLALLPRSAKFVKLNTTICSPHSRKKTKINHFGPFDYDSTSCILFSPWEDKNQFKDHEQKNRHLPHAFNQGLLDKPLLAGLLLHTEQ